MGPEMVEKLTAEADPNGNDDATPNDQACRILKQVRDNLEFVAILRLGEPLEGVPPPVLGVEAELSRDIIRWTNLDPDHSY